MKTFNFKSLSPYIVALAIFILIPVIYFSPVLDGKRIRGHDTTHFLGMSKKINDFRKEHKEEPLWTDAMFAGMPAYQISVQRKENKVNWVNKLFNLTPRPISFVFTYFVGFFILLIAFGVNPWLSIIGALAFGLSSYFFIIIGAGHNTKAIAIGYMAPVIAGIVLSFKRKYLLGAAISGLFLALNLKASHPQITYYTMLIVLVIGIVELYNALKTKEWGHFLKAVGSQIIPVVLALATTSALYITTLEYSKETIRGKSELSTEKENRSGGLDKDYITSWSYGKMETFTFLIPNLQGGSSSTPFKRDSETYKELRKRNSAQHAARMGAYWGSQPGTSGPVYIGAIICFLFILGLFVVKGSTKWWIVGATALSIILSWGHNLMWFTDIFIDYFPMYNKFRTVTMILVIAELTIPLLGILAIDKIIKGKIEKSELIRALKYSFIITGGLVLLFILIPGLAGSFLKEQEMAGYPAWLQEALASDRKALLRADAFRSLLFIIGAAAAIWFFIKDKLKATPLIAILAVLLLTDMWPINKRYLNDNNFNATKRTFNQPFKPSIADKAIMTDKSDYRVLNLTTSPFNDASTSYFHKSVGGYHGAKLRRYQEFIEHQLQHDMTSLVEKLQKGNVDASAFEGLNGLNMLNTKYIIVNPNGQPVVNPLAMGSAWFVNNIKVVENADEEITAVTKIDPYETAVIDQRFKEAFKQKSYAIDSTASILVKKHQLNKIVYQTKTQTPQFAVLSEAYYSKGWKVTIDGKPAEYARVNYILRGVEVPAGEHTIEFTFKPKSYSIGTTISFASSILLLLLCLGAFGFEIKQKLKEE